jgi:hypothetical protein
MVPCNQFPRLKELDLKVGCQWHGISGIDVSVPLIGVAPSYEIFCVFILGWPEKSALPDLCMCAESSIMTSIW